MTLKLSTPADFGPIEKVTELIELPHAQNGKRPVVRIRAFNGADLALASGGAPIMGGDPSSPERALDVVREVARLGIVEPEFSFGEAREPGRVWWNDLVAGNQHAVVQAIYRLSGIGASPDGEAATRTSTFPHERGRGADGEAPSAPVPPRKKAAP